MNIGSVDDGSSKIQKNNKLLLIFERLCVMYLLKIYVEFFCDS